MSQPEQFNKEDHPTCHDCGAELDVVTPAVARCRNHDIDRLWTFRKWSSHPNLISAHTPEGISLEGVLGVTQNVDAPAADETDTEPNISNLISGVTMSEPPSFVLPIQGKDPVQYAYHLAQHAFRHASKVLLWGPPGTGKTSLAARLELNGREVRNQPMTPETPAAELRGFFSMQGSPPVMQWVDGTGTSAWRHGWRWILDELDQAGPDSMSYLHAALNDRWVACQTGITLPSGEVVKPAASFQAVATMNSHPDRLLPAIKSRFTATIHIPLPLPDVVRHLPADILDPAMNSIMDGRADSRQWIALSELRDAFIVDNATPKEAMETAGHIVFGPQWTEWVSDMVIGTAPEPK